MRLIIIYGLPGTGKKTVGIELEKLTGYKLFDNHLVLDVVRKFIPKESPLSTVVARDFRMALIMGAMETGTTGIILTVAGGNPGAQEYIQACIDLVENSGDGTQLVKLTCDRPELLKRLADPARTGTKVRTEAELIERTYFDGIAGRESVIIDNTHLSAAEAAKKILLSLN